MFYVMLNILNFLQGASITEIGGEVGNYVMRSTSVAVVLRGNNKVNIIVM